MTTPLPLAQNGAARPLRRTCDECEHVVPGALDHHHAPGDQGDDDLATLVDPPARAVDVGEADGHPADAAGEPPEGKPQATLDVLANDVFTPDYTGQKLITSVSFGSL